MKLVALITGILGVATTSACIAAESCKPIHLSVLNTSGKEVRIISANDTVTTISARKGSINNSSEALIPQRAHLDNLCGRFTLMIGDVTQEIYVLHYKHMPEGHIASLHISPDKGANGLYRITGTRDVIPNLQAFKDWYSLRPLVKQSV